MPRETRRRALERQNTYKQHIKRHFASNNLQSMQRGIKTLTGNKSSTSQISHDKALPGTLKHFCAWSRRERAQLTLRKEEQAFVLQCCYKENRECQVTG